MMIFGDRSASMQFNLSFCWTKSKYFDLFNTNLKSESIELEPFVFMKISTKITISVVLTGEKHLSGHLLSENSCQIMLFSTIILALLSRA